MTPQTVPLQPVASQTVTVTLGNQRCQINVYHKDPGLFVDLYVSDVLVVGGVQAFNANKIVRDGYLGFVGDLAFFDTQGSSDPTYDGLGIRYALIYLGLP